MSLAVRLNKTNGLAANCLLVRRDGREAEIEDSASPIHDREGHVTGAVIVFRDVGTGSRGPDRCRTWRSTTR
jgi:PAS domain-containing protein